jgi:hypothetical protein
MNRREALKWFTAVPAMIMSSPQPSNQPIVLEIDGRKVAEAILPHIPERIERLDVTDISTGSRRLIEG